MRRRWWFVVGGSWLVAWFSIVGAIAAQADIIDTYSENFDAVVDGETINGVDKWQVDQGSASDAITESATTYAGGGALQLTGASPAANVSRPSSYGDLTPCWVEFVARPSLGAQTRGGPSGKIAAVSFDFTGKIYASNGSAWEDTGKTFASDKWYRVILRLNFRDKLYDIYIFQGDVPMIEFIPAKENLAFIDSSITSLSQFGFEGVYNTARQANTYIDDIVVHFIYRLEVITAPQTLMENQASSPITVQLQNANSEPQTAWKDIALELRSSSQTGEFSMDRDVWKPIVEAIVPKNAQQVTFYYKDSKNGKPMITAKEYPDRGWLDAIQQEKVVAKAAYFDIQLTAPQVAGEQFSAVITAKDEDGNVNEFYDEEIEILANYISPDSGTTQISPPSISSGFKKGVLGVNLTYPDCGMITITVRDKDEPSKTGESGEVLFIPAALGVACDSAQVTGRPFTLNITGLNSRGKAAPNYKGPVVISAAGVSPEEVSGAVFTPSGAGAEEFEGGSAQMEAKYNLWGTIKIKASDQAYPAQSGLSEPARFLPSGLSVEVKPPAGRDFFYTGETIEIVFSVLDADKTPIANYQGTIDIAATLGLNVGGEYQFEEADKGRKVFSVSVDSSGEYMITASEKESGLKAEGPKIKVRQASLQVVSTFAPVGTAEVVIKLVDEDGRIITSENTLAIQVTLTEESPDSSSASTAVNEGVVFNKGVARVMVSNTQAEQVIITPMANYDFKIKPGTITFGRVAKTGVGTLMWREIKE